MCAFAGLTVIVCASIFTAAALVPAPPAVLPFVVALCIAGPMLAAWELRGMRALAFRAPDQAGASEPPPLDGRAIAALRRHLKRLPETQHPLGL